MELYQSKFWEKSYDKHVKPPLDYPTDSLGKLFDDAMLKFPDRPACYFMGREFSFKALRDMVHKFATFLQKNGLKKGDRVAISLANCPQYMAAHFGTILAGGVSSGVSPLLSEDETVYQLNDSEAKFIVILDAVYEKVLRNIVNKTPNLKGIIVTNIMKFLKKLPPEEVTPSPGKQVVWFRDVMETPIDVKEVKINLKEDLALLQYTGGTTGRPKGTQLTHSNILSNIIQINEWLQLDPGKEVALSAFPLFHLAGLMMCMNTVILSNSQVLIANPRDIDYIIKEMIKREPTLIVNVPTLYINISTSRKKKRIPSSTLKNVKMYISGASPFPAESIRDFEKAMDAENKLLEVYGMTETSPLLTMNPRFGKKKIGTVGLPVPDTELKLVDIETGEPVEIGQPGEILCRGPQVTPGYYNKPEANKKTFTEDGFLHTGDVGVMDEDGYITIVDRTKDMIIVSGYKVYSVHVEDVLTKHPDIEICALIGVKDPKRPGSEIVKAVVKLKKGVAPTDAVKDNIQKFAKESLSKYENPKIWDFREELPLSAVGKVLKRELRVENQ